jgi:hypothetical protein
MVLRQLVTTMRFRQRSCRSNMGWGESMVGFARIAILGVALLAAAGLTSGAATGSRVADTCKPGVKRIAGVRALVFCGPATAALRFSGKAIGFRNGRCTISTKRTFTVNVGTVTLAAARPKFAYFGITVSRARRDGVYKGAAVGFQWRGKSYSVLENSVRLSKNRTRGTFAGRIGGSGARVSGSFTC